VVLNGMDEVSGKTTAKSAETPVIFRYLFEGCTVRNWNKHAKREWNAAKKRMLNLRASPLVLLVTNRMQLLRRFSV